jgi:hypothetical protein
MGVGALLRATWSELKISTSLTPRAVLGAHSPAMVLAQAWPV